MAGMVLAAALALAAWITYRQAAVLLEDQLGRRAMGLALAVAQGIDPAAYQELRAAESTYHPYFVQMQQRLRALRENQGAAFVYSEERVGPLQIRYLLDADHPGGPQSPGPFETDVMDATSARAHVMGRPLYGPVTFHPVWGRLITGYAPITAPDGQVLGVVGVDFRAADLAHMVHKVQRVGWSAAALGAALGGTAGWVLAGWRRLR